MKRLSIAFALALCTMASTARAQHQTRPLDRSNLDTTCAPCTNFYQFANGGWIAHNPVPAAFSTWGSLNELADANNEHLHEILEEAAKARTTSPDPNTRRLGTFYAACMDTAVIERAGAAPIAADLQAIASISTPADVQSYIFKQAATSRGGLLGFGSQQDARNSSEVIAGIGQSGIGMPDRDYYFNSDARSVAFRAAYQKHIANDLVLAGQSRADADAAAARILALETTLAASHLTRVQSRDPNMRYHRMTPAQLKALAPDIDWPALFAAEGATNVAAINVSTPKYVSTVDSALRTVPVADWKAYFTWNLVRRASPSLSSQFVNEDFAFGQLTTGAKEQLPRYKKCVAATDRAMGQALGKAYVDKYFTPEAKARATTMVNNLKLALRDRFGTLSWMSDSTRRMANAKLDAFTQKIGYPDTWKDYSGLTIDPSGSYYADNVAVGTFDLRTDVARIGKPVDRTTWGMSQPTVNAYYSASTNEIVFPAGIMQPPFFDPNADDAVNYGGMGAVIGHEMTHGFDDQGAQFDAQGNLKTWFAAADLEKFKAKTGAYANQFDTYTILDSAHVNGKLTNGENIADLGGLTIAYAAMEKAYAGKSRAKIDGFTPEQRFFLAWAQVWRSNTTPEASRLRLATDPHSPSIWRVNGPLSNMPEFAKAWGCAPGTPMARTSSSAVAVW